MKRIFLKAGVGLAIIAGLSGCGFQNAMELYGRAQEFKRIEAINDNLGAANAADVAALTGTAVYTGQAGFGGMVDDTNNVLISAPITLTADFDRLAVRGEITDTMISELTDSEVADLRAGKPKLTTIMKAGETGTGTIALDGTISGEALTLATSGDVTAASGTYTFAGDVAGTFRGADASGVALDETASFTVTRNGDAFQKSIFQAELTSD